MDRRTGRWAPRAIAAAAMLATMASATDAPPMRAGAMLRDGGGKTVGTATLRQMPLGLRLTIKADGLPPGVHGLHIHAAGACDAPDFKGAGGHWNPTMKQHGKDNPAGMHRGDLPNLVIGAKGSGRLRAFVPGARLAGGETALLDADGAAIVVHAGPDDYRSDPAGNSGARIACGVIAIDVR